MAQKIFPEFIEQDGFFETDLRFLSEDGWYFSKVKYRGDITGFIKEVYIVIIMHKYSPELKSVIGQPIYTIDTNQESEISRLINTYFPLLKAIDK